MYPATIINKRVVAEHLDSKLIDAYTRVRDERILAKKTDKIKADGLKIVLNSYFG